MFFSSYSHSHSGTPQALLVKSLWKPRLRKKNCLEINCMYKKAMEYAWQLLRLISFIYVLFFSLPFCFLSDKKLHIATTLSARSREQ